MRELNLGRAVPDAAVRELAEQFARDLEGTVEAAPGSARLTFPVRHRFYRGVVTVRLGWEKTDGGTVLRAQTDPSGAEVNHAGRALLVLGAVACLPWLLWWFFPVLLPLVPLSALFVFLAWLGVARKPNFFGDDFFLRAMAARLPGEDG